MQPYCTIRVNEANLCRNNELNQCKEAYSKFLTGSFREVSINCWRKEVRILRDSGPFRIRTTRTRANQQAITISSMLSLPGKIMSQLTSNCHEIRYITKTLRVFFFFLSFDADLKKSKAFFQKFKKQSGSSNALLPCFNKGRVIQIPYDLHKDN